MIGLQLAQRRHFRATTLRRQGTPGMEHAARRHVEQGWREAGNAGEVALGLGRRQA